MSTWSPGSRYGPVPDWLREAVDAVLADLQQPTPVGVRLGYEDSNRRLWVSEAGERGRWGYESWDLRGVELLVNLADSMQEQFFPETRAAWGEARPECPGHPHPAQAREVAGEACWVCPVDGRRIAMIGRVGQDH
jgi:hypothetical protein